MSLTTCCAGGMTSSDGGPEASEAQLLDIITCVLADRALHAEVNWAPRNASRVHACKAPPC